MREAKDLSARRGAFANGMRYVTWASGPKTLLVLPGGPGSMLPGRLAMRSWRKRFAPYVAAGYQPWIVGRRWHMPRGHSIADMADDYARMVTDELGGQVDLVIGESYGGCVAQHLAAAHPHVADKVVLLVSACRVTEEGLRIDGRLAAGLAAGDAAGAGEAFMEYLVAGDRLALLRRVLGRVVGPLLLSSQSCPAEDVLVEFAAEEDFDAEPVLGDIRVPVLMVCGDRDRFFAPADVERTAAAIPDCTLVWYHGKGHIGTAESAQVPQDVLAFA